MKGWKNHARMEKILYLAMFGVLIIAGVGLLVLILQDNQVLAMEEDSSIVAEQSSEESREASSGQKNSPSDSTTESSKKETQQSTETSSQKESSSEGSSSEEEGQESSDEPPIRPEESSETSPEESLEAAEEESSEEESSEESSEEESSEEESSEEESSEESSEEESSEESSSPEEESPEEPSEEPSEESSEEHSQSTLSGELVMGSVDDDYFADALFIGDSRIVGLSDYGTIHNATFFAKVGISNAGLLVSGSLPGVLSSGQYGKVYLCCGINNIGMGAETCFSDFLEIMDIVRTYQPDAIVYVMSNVYVTPEYWSEHPDFNNDEIRAYNYMLSSLDDGGRTVFLNIAGLFESENGFLKYEYTFDGIHLVAEGYEEWSYYLKNHAMIAAE